MNLFKALIFLLFLFIPQISQANEVTIDFKKDFERLQVLQEKFRGAITPIEKFNYSAATIKYLEDMLERIKQVNDVYYRPAILMITGEIKRDKIKNTNQVFIEQAP